MLAEAILEQTTRIGNCLVLSVGQLCVSLKNRELDEDRACVDIHRLRLRTRSESRLLTLMQKNINGAPVEKFAHYEKRSWQIQVVPLTVALRAYTHRITIRRLRPYVEVRR